MSNTQTGASGGTYQVGLANVSETVVEAVASTLGVDPFELPPLGSTVDADSLDGLWYSMYGESRPGYISVSFSYAGCHVSIEDGESVTVRQIAEQ